LRQLLSGRPWFMLASVLSCPPRSQDVVQTTPAPALRFEVLGLIEPEDSAFARRRRGPVSQGQIFLRDSVVLPEGGMDLQGELVVHRPDTLELLLHIGRDRGGVVMMSFPAFYEASITNLPTGRYLLRRTILFHRFSGDIRRSQAAPDSLVTIR
jgi:hypothetical protein